MNMWEPIKKHMENLVETERVAVYEASFFIPREFAPDYTEWERIMRSVPSRDRIEIYLSTDAGDGCRIRSGSEARGYHDFLADVLDDEKICVKASIRKTIGDAKFSVYCFRKFADDLLAQPLADVLNIFAELLGDVKQRLIFELMDCKEIFYTKTLFFIPSGNHPAFADFNREGRLADCRETSYFYQQEMYKLIPDDFKIEVDYEENPFRRLFAKLEAVLSACYLVSHASIEKKEIKLRVMGQRAVSHVCMLDDIPENGILYRIYDWVYSGGNAIDKAVIARNIICLHCRYEPLPDMGKDVLDAIQCNYNLYLKDNVTQYLELKNRVAEFISKVVSQTGDYATKILDRYKSNMFAVFTFLFTVILANIVSDQPLDNIFTRDITCILEMVLAGSVVYMVICCWQTHCQMKKVYDSYQLLKDSYRGILTEEDIRECFQDDRIINSMKKSIQRSEAVYLVVWILSLFFMLAFLEMAGGAPVLLPAIRYMGGF